MSNELAGSLDMPQKLFDVFMAVIASPQRHALIDRKAGRFSGRRCAWPCGPSHRANKINRRLLLLPFALRRDPEMRLHQLQMLHQGCQKDK